MKLYLANGRYVGTQADAKKADKDFRQVEVPTDKEGLIAYLNEVVTDVYHAECAQDEYETVLARVELTASKEDLQAELARPWPDIDDAFEELPIQHQLTLTCLALENARKEIGRLQENERGGIAPYRERVELRDPLAEETAEELDPFA